MKLPFQEIHRTTTCTNHCSHCGRHFHSLEAFEAHRTGDYNSNDPETGRRCLAPCEILNAVGEERLEAVTAEGECRMYAVTESPVTIWTVTGAAHGVRQRLSERVCEPVGKRLSVSEPVSVPRAA